MARRVPNRLPPHEPSVIVDPRLYLDHVEALDVAPDPRHVSSAPPSGAGRTTVLRAVTLIALSAWASFSSVRYLRTLRARTAHAALVVTPLAPPVGEAPAPAPVVQAVPLPLPLAAPEPAAGAARTWLARVQAARALLAAGKLDDAEAAFREVLAQRAEVPAAQLGLARVRLARGDCSEACALASAVLARIPQHAGARAVLAACLRVDAPAGASEAARRVAALPPNPF